MKNIIDNLRSRITDSDAFQVEHPKGTESHFIGINNKLKIALLIRTNNQNKEKIFAYRGKHIKVEHNKSCNIQYNDSTYEKIFSIISLDSNDPLLENIFLLAASDFINLVGPNPSSQVVQEKFDTFKSIFDGFQKKTSISEIGLWGELVTILSSSDIPYLANSWHINDKDLFDFNDGLSTLEVKTTLGNEREHIFSLNQIELGYDNNNHICSIMTSELEKNGLSVLDLIERIIENLQRIQRANFVEKVARIIGDKYYEYSNYFDYRSAVESKHIYYSNNIPSIRKDCIDPGVSKIKFTSSLEASDHTESSDMPLIKKVLN